MCEWEESVGSVESGGSGFGTGRRIGAILGWLAGTSVSLCAGIS